jgi:hypothetical protein
MNSCSRTPLLVMFALIGDVINHHLSLRPIDAEGTISLLPRGPLTMLMQPARELSLFTEFRDRESYRSVASC